MRVKRCSARSGTRAVTPHPVSAHSDLKPENLLLTAPGVESDLKIIDFGLAACVTPTTVLTSHVGER